MTSRKVTLSRTVIVIASVTAFCFMIACVTVIAIFVADGTKSSQTIAVLVGQLPTLLSVIVILAKLDNVESKADDMLNGVMDEKLQRNLHTVLDERDGTVTAPLPNRDLA